MTSTYAVVQTKDFNSCLRDLARVGKKGKDCITKSRAAMSEAATEGQIEALKRTNHGESRLPDIEKFDLGDGYRLVVQLVDGHSKTRAFLFCGTHDDADAWLDNHKGYRWVKNSKDKVLSFAKVSELDDARTSFAFPNTTIHESVLDTPLTASADTTLLANLIHDQDALEGIRKITFSEWETNPSDILERIERDTNTEIACIMDDYLGMLHKEEFDQAYRRLEVALGEAATVTAQELAKEVVSIDNSEIFVTWDDSHVLSDDVSWAEWLLYLHPEQKKIAQRDFNGPARLRGVSGSGKTCVMLHRARHLARKYNKPVLLIALTESVRKLLEKLARELCGSEYALVHTSTVNSHCEDIVGRCHPKGLACFTRGSDELFAAALRQAIQAIKSTVGFSDASLAQLGGGELEEFVKAEIYYIRTRLKPSDYRAYCDTKLFERKGRGAALGASDRQIVYAGLMAYVRCLAGKHVLDFVGAAAAALALLQKDIVSLEVLGIWPSGHGVESIRHSVPYRAVLADEVQDLSEIEVSVLAQTSSEDGKCGETPDGLFLVGDGVQKIYSKGFSLKQCGVNVANRSYTLKKNYRNTHEIASAAFALVNGHEFLDSDEEDIKRPTEPDYPTRRGMKPRLVKCRTMQDEVNFVAASIASHFDDEQHAASYCIIGLNSHIRGEVEQALRKAGLPAVSLRDNNYNLEDAKIYISTIESAKGYEFHRVFVIGLSNKEMPRLGSDEEAAKRDVSRLYVAMTRATDELCLSYAIDDNRGPSPFLSKISSHCAEYKLADGQLIALD